MAAQAIVNVSDTTFDTEVLQADVPVLVDFWAEWCGPCRTVAPVIDALAAQYGGKAKVAKLNVDHNPEIARRFNIRSIPTLLVFKAGEIKESAVGVHPKPALEQLLDRYV